MYKCTCTYMYESECVREIQKNKKAEKAKMMKCADYLELEFFSN